MSEIHDTDEATLRASHLQGIENLISDREMKQFPASWTDAPPSDEDIRRFLFLAEHYLIRAGFSPRGVTNMGVEIRIALADGRQTHE